jgi:hypothetical protein
MSYEVLFLLPESAMLPESAQEKTIKEIAS